MSFSKPWQTMVETPFSTKGISEKSKEMSKRMSMRMRGNVRVSTGRIYTTADMDARRLSAKLP